MTKDKEKKETFADLPEIPAAATQRIRDMFDNYLFFEVVERGRKRFTCTACKATFERGSKIALRSYTDNDVALDHAEHNHYYRCAACGRELQAVNIKKCKPENKNDEKCTVVFLPVSESKVYARCISTSRNFSKSLKGDWWTGEHMRYVFEPGRGDLYEAYCGGSQWERCRIARDAFLWNRGFYCEKYPYTAIYCDISGAVRNCDTEAQTEALDGTFLKYNSFFSYDGPHLFNAPYMKYLCWYARHPQIEMLVKMQRFEIVDEMILNNSDAKRYFDWDAKTPWGLHRMNKQLYDAFEDYTKRNRGVDRLAIFKTFRDLKGKKPKDFEEAEKILTMTYHTVWSNYGYHSNRKLAAEFISICRKLKRDPREIYRYLVKFKEQSAGACWHCPGITLSQAYEMWADYAAMAMAKEEIAAGKKSLRVYNFNPTPKDLKSEHDRLVAVQNQIKNERTRAERAKAALKRRNKLAERAEKYEKQFKKVVPNLAKVKELFSYSEEELCIVVPERVLDILMEGEVLSHCIGREGTAERYLGRIAAKESYLLFLRKIGEEHISYYTLEVEPDGTIRQKRTVDDKQDDGIVEAAPFLARWQAEVSRRMTAKMRADAKASREARQAEFDELRRTKRTIHYGELSGHLLVDVLEADLMINTNESEDIA